MPQFLEDPANAEIDARCGRGVERIRSWRILDGDRPQYQIERQLAERRCQAERVE
jgi:hypothetical protein